MKILRSWLSEFAALEGSPEELGAQMTALGMAVEEERRPGEALEGIVVATVLELAPHPDADRIQLVQVDAGDGEPLQICCGAFNMAVGDRVPLATLGTTMPDGMEIARRKLRGEWSNGMLCSATEIELGDDADGIHLLAPEAEPGTPLADALGLAGDTWWELEINPNRPDALSVAGIARDLAAHQGVEFTLPTFPVPRSGAPAPEVASVEIVQPDACGRFVARVLRSVTGGSSPTWLTTRLVQAGMRPINPVVDASNYVMLELGYPSHAYDLGTVAGSAIRVRRARDGEQVVTLDGVERAMQAGDVLICNGDDAPIGIAGIMGGASTEISDTTEDVLIEMAWWFPMQIARTSTRLGLRSEASIRFERGADPFGIDLAMDRFCSLLTAAGASVAPDEIDERGDLPDVEPITVRTPRVNAIMGADLEHAEIEALLTPLGFEVRETEAGVVHEVVAPTFRPDVVAEIDVIEEVARHWGYDRIERTVPPAVRIGRLTAAQHDRRLVRSVLTARGISEAMPLPFLGPGTLERCGLSAEGITLSNPLDASDSVLRPSLRPGLLGSLAYNASHRNPEVALFEVGHVFPPPPPGRQLPDEREDLAVAIGGADARAAVAVWDALVDALGLPATELAPAEPAGLHPTRSAEVRVDGATVGLVGEIDPDVLAAHEIPGRVAWLEVDLSAVLSAPHGEKTYTPVSRFPSTDIDLAFVVADATSSAMVEETIRDGAGDLLVDVGLFDVYRGEHVEDGARSLAFRLRFQATDRTLTDDEVGERRAAVVEAVAAAHDARLRG